MFETRRFIRFNHPPSTIHYLRSQFQHRARGSQQTRLAWDEEKPGAAPGRATNFQPSSVAQKQSIRPISGRPRRDTARRDQIPQ